MPHRFTNFQSFEGNSLNPLSGSLSIVVPPCGLDHREQKKLKFCNPGDFFGSEVAGEQLKIDLFAIILGQAGSLNQVPVEATSLRVGIDWE